jgi:hypothetical protein
VSPQQIEVLLQAALASRQATQCSSFFEQAYPPQQSLDVSQAMRFVVLPHT